jgi:hypothetical protein
MDRNPKTVGTFVMDGMLQGRLPDSPEFSDRVQEWLDERGKQTLLFDYTVEGSNFSLLADDAPKSGGGLPPGGIQEHLSQAFQKFIELLPAEQRMHVMSTLRSTEYRPDTAVQTIYIVAPPGVIKVQERPVDATTITPAPQLSTSSKVKMAAIGIGGAVFLLLPSSFFIDWKSWFFDRADELVPLKLEEITLETQAFEGFIGFEKARIDKKRGGLIIHATTGPDWIAAVSSTAPDTTSWKRFFAIAAIKKGSFRCDMFDLKGQSMGSATVFIEPLLKSPETDFFLPLPKRKVHRIVA